VKCLARSSRRSIYSCITHSSPTATDFTNTSIYKAQLSPNFSHSAIFVQIKTITNLFIHTKRPNFHHTLHTPQPTHSHPNICPTTAKKRHTPLTTCAGKPTGDTPAAAAYSTRGNASTYSWQSSGEMKAKTLTGKQCKNIGGRVGHIRPRTMWIGTFTVMNVFRGSMFSWEIKLDGDDGERHGD
jgi:hypothetical protein